MSQPVLLNAKCPDDSSCNILLVHGGPGLDSSYFRQPFSHIGLPVNVYVYDQDGFDSANIPSVDDLVKQLIETIEHLTTVGRQKPVVLGHSWGTHLVLSSLIEEGTELVAGVVLANPLPLDWDTLLACMGTLGSRLDAKTLSEVERLESEGTESAGKRAMELALPAYLGTRGLATPLTFERYCPAINSGVISQLEGFATDPATVPLPPHSLVLYGENDYLPPRVLGALDERAKVVVISGVGHFPFAEAPTEFGQAVSSFIDFSKPE